MLSYPTILDGDVAVRRFRPDRASLTLPYRERRRQLEGLLLNGAYWRTPETFDDGEALFDAVCERELEWIVAKRVDSRYMPVIGAGRKSRIGGTGATSSSANLRSTARVSARSSEPRGDELMDEFYGRLFAAAPA